MGFSQCGNDGNEERECEILVCFKNSKEIIVLEEAHSTIGDLEVWASNTLNESFKKFRNEVF
jgi:hypothetical protein